MLRVGELAEQTGVSVKTLRFYEEAGVLTPRGRTSAGYRLYTASAVERVRLVRGAQLAGLSLAEIADVCAALDDRSSHDAAHRLDEAQPRIDAALALLTDGSRAGRRGHAAALGAGGVGGGRQDAADAAIGLA